MGRKRQRFVPSEAAPTVDSGEEGGATAWVELDDPKLRSRLLYANPVCFLTTVDLERRRRNAMVVSWLTPINNHGVFVMAINKQRHSASLIQARRTFGLSPATAGTEDLLLAIGRSHGHLCDKFATIGGLKACALDNAPLSAPTTSRPAGNPFAALEAEGSDGEGEEGAEAEGGAGGGGVEPSLREEAGVVGGAAHLECRVLSVADSVEGGEGDEGEEGRSHHHLVTAKVVRAFASPEYWDGKHFAARGEAPPCLSFLGSQAFAWVTKGED